MSEIRVIVDKNDLDTIADAIREASGETESYTIDTLISKTVEAVSGSGGVELPTLTNEAMAADMLSGKQLIDSDGNVVTGTMASVTQATPSITVSSGGLITASATQTEGKVAAGTKSATKQLTVQAAQTITPSTTNKTIASGRYLTGTQTIEGDANLVASNIKSGVSIFGVAGSYEGSGGGSSGGGSFVTSGVTIRTKRSPTGTSYVSTIDYIADQAGTLTPTQTAPTDYISFITPVVGTILFVKTQNSPTNCTVTSDLELISFDASVGAVIKVLTVAGDSGFNISF